VRGFRVSHIFKLGGGRRKNDRREYEPGAKRRPQHTARDTSSVGPRIRYIARGLQHPLESAAASARGHTKLRETVCQLKSHLGLLRGHPRDLPLVAAAPPLTPPPPSPAAATASSAMAGPGHGAPWLSADIVPGHSLHVLRPGPLTAQPDYLLIVFRCTRTHARTLLLLDGHTGGHTGLFIVDQCTRTVHLGRGGAAAAAERLPDAVAVAR